MSPSSAGKKLSKAQDSANYRKGKDLKVGDTIEINVGGELRFEKIVSGPEKVSYGGTTNYRYRTESGTKTVGGGEFAKGKFDPAVARPK